MLAHVLKCNDKSEEVFLGTDEEAAERLLELKTKDAVKFAKDYGAKEPYPRQRLYWHIETVPLSVKEFK